MADTDTTPHHHEQPNKEHALSFGRAVTEYELGRPDYPAEAVRWILGHVRTRDERPQAVDVGAGTGKFTRALVDAGAEVTAVEPIPEMRAQLSANLPTIAVQPGTAESTGLPDDSADLVTFAQSWHWVDIVPASAEIARILRPGGVLALVWNVRDETVEWLAQLGSIIGASAAEEYDSLAPSVAAPFSPSDYAEFAWSATLTREELLAMVTSRSYIITMPEDARQDMLTRLSSMLATHPDTAGRDSFVVPYRTRVSIVTAS